MGKSKGNALDCVLAGADLWLCTVLALQFVTSCLKGKVKMLNLRRSLDECVVC